MLQFSVFLNWILTKKKNIFSVSFMYLHQNIGTRGCKRHKILVRSKNLHTKSSIKDFEKLVWSSPSAPSITEHILHCRLCYFKPGITQLRLTALLIIVTELTQTKRSRSQPPWIFGILQSTTLWGVIAECNLDFIWTEEVPNCLYLPSSTPVQAEQFLKHPQCWVTPSASLVCHSAVNYQELQRLQVPFSRKCPVSIQWLITEPTTKLTLMC